MIVIITFMVIKGNWKEEQEIQCLKGKVDDMMLEKWHHYLYHSAAGLVSGVSSIRKITTTPF